ILSIPAFSLYLLTRDPRVIFRLSQFGCRLGFKVGGVRVEVRGLEKLDPSQPYVFAANHASNLDPPLLFVFLQRDVGFLAKKEIFRLPVFYPGLYWMESTPIDRAHRELAIAGLHAAARLIRRGRSYIAFPEGTRSRDGRLLPFKKGTFHLAREAGVPIVPVTICGTHELMPRSPFCARPGEVIITVHSPLTTSDTSSFSLDTLVKSTRSSIESALPFAGPALTSSPENI
ncbi:MAG: 1-acyl-sn-glycerol-3-phosphate acyltransferase, partial [Acidobacteria bacterium]|nr:1-acyl-sn-glycerol-3-phosphate acyltransferase [Acidobacteriota bacterium]